MPKRRRAPGAGRKPLGESARSVTWTIKVTPAMAAAVDDIAAKAGTTRAATLLEAIELAIYASRSAAKR